MKQVVLTTTMRLLAFSAVLLAVACGPAAKEEAPKTLPLERPNILFIMSDDHAPTAISAYGSPYMETPNLDRIADEGVLFQNAFCTNSICGPSRAAFLTGKYSNLNGFYGNGDHFDSSQVTFPKLLQEAGYQTSMYGKWHLGSQPTGFDVWQILVGQGEYYQPRLARDQGDTIVAHGYSTTVLTDLALEKLKQRDADSAPFMMMLNFKAPHRNWMPDTEHLGVIDEGNIPMPKTFFDDYEGRSRGPVEQDLRIANMSLYSDLKLSVDADVADTSRAGLPMTQEQVGNHWQREWKKRYGRMDSAQQAAWDAYYDTITENFLKADLSGEELAKWKYQRYMHDYLATTISTDVNVGRVLDYLEESGLAENTIVIYTADQGFYLGEHGWYDKRFMYEPSLRLPLMVRFPEAYDVKGEVEEIVMNIDMAPTLLELAHAPQDTTQQGRSMVPLFWNRPERVEWRDALYYHYYSKVSFHTVHKHYGIRTERYKLIRFYGDDWDEWELYDLEADPDEVNNVYGDPAYAEVVANLVPKLVELRAQYKNTDGPPLEDLGKP